MGDFVEPEMAAEQDAVKAQLLQIVQKYVADDASFVDLSSVEGLPAKISEEVMTFLREHCPLTQGYKLFVKTVLLQVNGMASSTNTLWALEGEYRDYNLSVAWTNSARCSVWLTVIANP